MSETLELAVVTAQNSVDIFTRGGLSALLDEVEKKVRAIPLDVSTATGRDQIRSVAYKVTRTKTALDTEAKKLTETWRDSTKRVNEERKVSQERLDALADEVRAPLTEFENKDKVRVSGHEGALAEMSGLLEMVRSRPSMDVALLEDHQRDFASLHVGRIWEEFSSRACGIRATTSNYLNERLTARRKFDADQAELERLRKEEIERKAMERDEKLKAEAAENARLAAERKAREAADAEARRVIEAAKAEQRRVDAEADLVRAEHERAQKAIEAARKKEEDARLLAEKRANDADLARVAAGRKAEEDLIAAKAKARRDAEAAVTKERERVEAQRMAEETERAKREANEKNKARIRAEITADLNANEIDIVGAIIEGRIRHLRVIW